MINPSEIDKKFLLKLINKNPLLAIEILKHKKAKNLSFLKLSEVLSELELSYAESQPRAVYIMLQYLLNHHLTLDEIEDKKLFKKISNILPLNILMAGYCNAGQPKEARQVLSNIRNHESDYANILLFNNLNTGKSLYTPRGEKTLKKIFKIDYDTLTSLKNFSRKYGHIFSIKPPKSTKYKLPLGYQGATQIQGLKWLLEYLEPYIHQKEHKGLVQDALNKIIHSYHFTMSALQKDAKQFSKMMYEQYQKNKPLLLPVSWIGHHIAVVILRDENSTKFSIVNGGEGIDKKYVATTFELPKELSESQLKKLCNYCRKEYPKETVLYTLIQIKEKGDVLTHNFRGESQSIGNCSYYNYFKSLGVMYEMLTYRKVSTPQFNHLQGFIQKMALHDLLEDIQSTKDASSLKVKQSILSDVLHYSQDCVAPMQILQNIQDEACQQGNAPYPNIKPLLNSYSKKLPAIKTKHQKSTVKKRRFRIFNRNM